MSDHEGEIGRMMDGCARCVAEGCSFRWRMLFRPDCFKLWYDFVVENSWNPDIRGVPISSIPLLRAHVVGALRKPEGGST